MSKNLCAKRVEPKDAYEVYATADFSWIHYVLKKYQSPEAEEKNEYARWFCAVSSPMTFGSLDLGDVYAAEVKRQGHLILNPLQPLREAEKPYQIETPIEFLDCWRYGDGYDVMEAVTDHGWNSVDAWGKPGWNLGSWPLVIVFVRRQNGIFQVAEYVEGDVTVYSCPNKWIRQQIIDGLAFFHWKHQDEEWMKAYDSIDKVPLDSELRGPYRA